MQDQSEDDPSMQATRWMEHAEVFQRCAQRVSQARDSTPHASPLIDNI